METTKSNAAPLAKRVAMALGTLTIMIAGASGLGLPAHAGEVARPLTTALDTGTAGNTSTTLSTLIAAPLTTVVVDGSSAYSAAQLFAVYRDQLGRTDSHNAARAIGAALSGLYSRDGYVRPEIRADETLATRGTLRLSVHEARITNVILEGETGAHLPALERIGTQLENARPLRREDVPQALRSMRAIPGLEVSANTRRVAHIPNAYELVVRSDYQPVEGVVRMNNRGTEQVGPFFVMGQVFANGLFGHQEKAGLIYASATDPSEYLGAGIYVETPIGSQGTQASVMVFRSDSAPHEAPIDLEHEFARERMTLRVTKPFREGSSTALSISGGFEVEDLTIDRDGLILREDRLRIVDSRLRASWRAAKSQLSASIQVRKGLDGLGGGLQSPYSARDPRREDFLITLLQTSAQRQLAESWSLRIDTFAQHSGYVLPDSERFKIGGDRLGRGFEVAEIVGDRGLGGKVELRRKLVNTESFAGRISTYACYDIGAAWKQDRPGRESAATASGGVALQGAALTGYFELAKPLTGTDVEGKRHVAIFAELAYRF